MNIGEFSVAHESRSDYVQVMDDFKAMGVRCVSKTYDDPTEIKRDVEKFRYAASATNGRYRWLVVSKRGMDLLLINTEVKE